MRIVPYESAAVKVRVEVEAGKLGYFPIHRSKEPVCPGRVGSGTAESPGAKWLVDGTHATGRGRQIGKFCPKWPTGLTDTDL